MAHTRTHITSENTPMTLTTNQRKYRKLKEDGKRDFRHVERDDGTRGIRVTRKAVCARVSPEANERLNHWAEYWKKDRWEMLNHIIIQGLPRYASRTTEIGLKRYNWDDALLNPEEKRVRYKATTGTHQINERITSTAWKKLQCHSTATKMSKARIIQSLLLGYRPISPEQLKKQWFTRMEQKEFYANWKPEPLIPQPLSPEEQAEFDKRKAEVLREGEERWMSWGEEMN